MHQDADKRNEKTFDLYSNLKKIAVDRGFRISDNPGGGNCMFYALSGQLKFAKGIQSSAAELRQEIVQYLQQNPKLVNKLCSCYFEMKFTTQAQKYTQNDLIVFFCLLYLCAPCVSK